MSISITSVSVGCYAYNLVATLQSYSSNFSMLFWWQKCTPKLMVQFTSLNILLHAWNLSHENV